MGLLALSSLYLPACFLEMFIGREKSDLQLDSTLTRCSFQSYRTKVLILSQINTNANFEANRNQNSNQEFNLPFHHSLYFRANSCPGSLFGLLNPL